MSDAVKTRFLKAWGLQDGTPEAEAAWQAKQAFKPIRLTPLIMRDLEPYQAMGTDVATGKPPMITSRSQHREYLRRNNYVELGNDIRPPERREELTDRSIGHDIKKTIEQKGIRL